MFGKLLVAFSLASLATAAPAPLPYVFGDGDQVLVLSPVSASEASAPVPVTAVVAVAPAAESRTQPAAAPTPAPPAPAVTPATPATPVVAPTPQTTPAPAAPRTPRAPAAPRIPETAPTPAVAPTPPPPRALGQLANVIVDVVISDRGPGGPENRRVISATAADGERASVRNSSTTVKGDGPPSHLSLDVQPVIAEGGRVRLHVGLDFQLVEAAGDAADPGGPAFGQVRLTQNVVLESGKPLVISQSTAPGTQRTVSVEVKATVLK